jgi:hypothetical protein
MKGQIYSIYLLDRNDWGLAKPGQFVFEDNNSNELTGFICAADNKEVRICAFAPIELPENAFDVQEIIELDKVMELLDNALKHNPDMKEEWKALL